MASDPLFVINLYGVMFALAGAVAGMLALWPAPLLKDGSGQGPSGTQQHMEQRCLVVASRGEILEDLQGRGAAGCVSHSDGVTLGWESAGGRSR